MGKILLSGHEENVFVEGKAGGTITPGDLITWTAPGVLGRHSAAGGNARTMFALDFPQANKGIDDNYAQGDEVRAVHARRGALILARVAEGAAAIAFGDPLESAGDGTVRKHTPPAIDSTNSRSIVGFAMEAIDNSGGQSAVRIKIEVA